MTVRHVLVTNDFPPKLGGIQSYLYELWRRLDPDGVCVLTTPHEGASRFDAAQSFRIERDRDRVLFPTRGLAGRINDLAWEHRAELIVLDPLLPVGAIAPKLSLPYAVVVHGAEVTVPARVGLFRRSMAQVLCGASQVIAAGTFPAAEAERVAGRSLRLAVVPPGVDCERFSPLSVDDRQSVRRDFGIDPDAQLVVSLSRLVPRKGMDVLIEAAARLRHEFPRMVVAIGGEGRDRPRLERLSARCGAPVRFIGRVEDDRLAQFVGMADVFAMCCRNRWSGLEQEGFGIVFLEAAACGIPQIAGLSGGSADAVANGETGVVVEDPRSVGSVTTALRMLLLDDARRLEWGAKARRRAERGFDYDVLAEQLDAALSAATGSTR